MVPIFCFYWGFLFCFVFLFCVVSFTRFFCQWLQWRFFVYLILFSFLLKKKDNYIFKMFYYSYIVFVCILTSIKMNRMKMMRNWETKHLSTDQFLNPQEAFRLIIFTLAYSDLEPMCKQAFTTLINLLNTKKILQTFVLTQSISFSILYKCLSASSSLNRILVGDIVLMKAELF